eukprot:CAMPEP_0197464630 /NCGR_PEP_ID=MMETSP1175-20131217/64121_1 /TAXON_ID=1003142 /ORGANISM="Triceratium dubium, Strain CCMP147" /LENGTH=273 /DNA_ID=CAMNT_0043000613 /DNA_START=166 /DNA_END=990 /DNA_ORIENTATION=+
MLPVTLLKTSTTSSDDDGAETVANDNTRTFGPAGYESAPQDILEKDNGNEKWSDEDDEANVDLRDEEDYDDEGIENKETLDGQDRMRSPPPRSEIGTRARRQTKKHGKKRSQSEMGDILRTVHRFLSDKEFAFCLDSDRGLIRLSVGGERDGSFYNIVFDAREELRQLYVYTIIPRRVPEDRRAEMAMFVARANFGLAIGNFELDLNDGEVRYKVTIDVEDGTLSCKMVQNMYDSAFAMAERYYDGMMAVCDEGKDAATAVAESEGRLRFISQ